MTGQRGHRVDRIELDDAGTGVMQRVEQGGGCVVRTVGVVDDVDRHAVVQPIYQHIGQVQLPIGHVLEDEVFQVDVIARLLHCLEHGGQCLLPVRQQARLVAEHQRAIGECELQGIVALQRVRIEIGIDIRHGGARLQSRRSGQGEKIASAGKGAHHAWRHAKTAASVLTEAVSVTLPDMRLRQCHVANAVRERGWSLRSQAGLAGFVSLPRRASRRWRYRSGARWLPASGSVPAAGPPSAVVTGSILALAHSPPHCARSQNAPSFCEAPLARAASALNGGGVGASCRRS